MLNRTSNALPYAGLAIAGLLGVWAAAALPTSATSTVRTRLYVDQVLKSFGQLPDGSGVGMIWLKIPKVMTPAAGLMTVVVCVGGGEIGREVLFTGTQSYTYDPRIVVDFEHVDQIDTLVRSEIWPEVAILDHWVAAPGFKYERVGESAMVEDGDLSCPLALDNAKGEPREPASSV